MSTNDNLTAKTISAQNRMTKARPSVPKQPDLPQRDPGQKDVRRDTEGDSVGALVASRLAPKTAGKTSPSVLYHATSAPTCVPTSENQCDPGQKGFRLYTLQDGAGNTVAWILVPKTAGSIGRSTYSPGTEYWFGVSTSAPVRALTVTWVDHWWTDLDLVVPARLSFTMIQAPTWTSTTGAPAPCATLFVGPGLAIAWEIRYVGAAWQGTLGWFTLTGTNDVFRGTMPPGGVTLYANTLVGPSPWYNTDVATM
jgi:hypothetical protein